MLTPPSPRLIGSQRPAWAIQEIDCPFGLMVCAVCPGDVPDAVTAALHEDAFAFSRELESDRRREWVAGRHCLAGALDRVGAPRSPILPSKSGAPEIPRGYAGSLSHKGPLTVALTAVGSRGVGVDLEHADRRDAKLGPRILTVREYAHAREMSAGDIAMFAAIHFSLKEAVYKALDATEQVDLDFGDIEVYLPLPSEIGQHLWASGTATCRGVAPRIVLAVLLDGPWVIAAASRG